MSVRKSRVYRFGILFLTLACLGAAGYLGYRTFVAPGSPARGLKDAEAAYARGAEAYQQKTWGDAATRFDESRLLADKAMETLKEQTEGKKIPPEEAQALQGRIMWVKARAIRDRAYAKAQGENKPLPDVHDPQYNETYHTFTAIPDDEARQDARTALRIASTRLGTDTNFAKDVLKEAIRSELSYTPIDWGFVEPLLRKAIELNPKDARAQYYLARFEYDQPGDDRATPLPLDRRAADRIDRARDYLAAAKQAGSPYWRTIGLEAEVLAWPLRTAAVRKLKPDAVAAAERAVDPLLFDPLTGAVAVAGRGEKLTALGAADAAGLVSVLTVGSERAAAEARKPGGTAARVKEVAQAALSLANKLADEAPLQPYLTPVAPALLAIAARAQPILSKSDPAGWREYAANLDALLNRAPDAVKRSFALRLQYARLLTADAALATDAARAKELRARAEQELTEGLAAAEEAKAPGAVIDEFHGELAEYQLQTGARADAIEPHLNRLRASAVPRLKAWGQLIEGRSAEAQGRLEKAKKLLQAVAADRANPDFAFQANVLLAAINSALGDSAAALGSWREVEARYAAADLPAGMRTWADERFGGADRIAANLVVANLGAATAAAVKHARANPGKPIPPDLLTGYEAAAEELAKKLRPPSAADRTARAALAEYYLITGRRAGAEARVGALAVDYPDGIDVLRLNCRVLAAPTEPGTAPNPNGVAAADILIRKFLKDYPGDKAARLFNAEWLVRTDRAEKAVEYLRAAANFPGGADPAVDRVLAVALLRTGQRDEAHKVLGALPAEPLLDAVLIEAATTKEVFERRLKDALGKYEDQGLFRLYDAALRLWEGKYEEAVRGFASAVEFTRVGAAARTGLRRALVRYGEVDPAKARDLAVRVAADLPDEPDVYLAAALAARQLDDVGAPDDKWEATKTMYAAANRWEVAAVKGGTAPADAALTRVQFRLLAGDIAGAKQDAVAALNRSPKHVALLLLMAELSLVPPADTARAREFLAAAARENPNDPRLPLIEAAVRASADDWAGAAAVYTKLVEQAGRNPAPYRPLVATLEAAGNKADALRWARTWAEKAPDDNGATAEVVRLLAIDGQKGEAVKVADGLVANREAEARKRLAAIVPPLAAADADKIVAEARGSALLAVAGGFFRAKALDDAESRLRDVLKAFPDLTSVRLSVADIALSRKEWDKALALYREVLKQTPRHFVAGNNVAWILAEIKNDPVAALAIVEEIRKARGDRVVAPERLPADFLDTIGAIYVKLNQPARSAEMRTMFEAAVTRYPTDPRMHLFLGHALAATGERARAVRSFDEAIRLAGTKNGIPDDQNKAVSAAADAARKKIQN